MPDICAACVVVPPTVPPSARVAMFDELARKGAENPFVASIARDLRARLVAQLGREPTYGELIQWLMDRLHDLVEYKPDPTGLEMVQTVEFSFAGGASNVGALVGTPVSPLTGLPKGVADCEDLAIAFVALCLANGIPARTRWWDQPGAALNHVSAEVLVAGQWVPAETTIPGAWVGENPYEALARVGNGYLLQRVFGSA